MSDVRIQLSESLAPAQWEWLRPHAVAGRMVIVNPNLDLIEVGEAMAADAAAQMKDWLDCGSIAVADQADIDRLDRLPGRTEIQALIVQPFVLIAALSEVDIADSKESAA